MGNQQGGGPGRRDRFDGPSGGHHSSSSRHHRVLTSEDECPVQVKIAKTGGQPSPTSSVPSMQYENTTDFPVVIKWTGASNKSVSITGSWDGWKRKIPLVKSHDDFTTIINLPEGKHEYKFLVDGTWNCDNSLPKTDNKMGGQNNVVLIDRQDFEVFDALDKDLQSTMVSNTDHNSGNTVNEKELEKTKPYGQEIPDRRDFEKAHHPPVLPPHLLQVILNKDTPVSCDPNVLPEPNHVMLNHLYALSIKDGVMVLSATHRYRKKYVTTLLYRPI